MWVSSIERGHPGRLHLWLQRSNGYSGSIFGLWLKVVHLDKNKFPSCREKPNAAVSFSPQPEYFKDFRRNKNGPFLTCKQSGVAFSHHLNRWHLLVIYKLHSRIRQDVWQQARIKTMWLIIHPPLLPAKHFKGDNVLSHRGKDHSWAPGHMIRDNGVKYHEQGRPHVSCGQPKYPHMFYKVLSLFLLRMGIFSC